MAEWEATNEIRYSLRAGKAHKNVIVLQQRWRKRDHIGQYDYEWRDVPTVMEEGVT